jgi:hypothetical protein
VGLTNVVVEWLTLLFRIREVPGWNLGPETDYPEAFRRFPQSLQANAGKTTSFRPQPLPPTFFPINHSRTTPSFDAIQRVTEKASLNKLQSYGLNMREWQRARHVARMWHMRNVVKNLTGKPEGTSLCIHRQRLIILKWIFD